MMPAQVTRSKSSLKFIWNNYKHSHPLVSIVIPTYKRPKKLADAIKSAIDQDAKIEFEVIIIDNCADDAMAEEVDKVVKSFCCGRLKLYRNEENIGMYDNWNRCIDVASAEWVTILNDDDLLYKNFLKDVFDRIFDNNIYSAYSCDVIIRNRLQSVKGWTLLKKAQKKIISTVTSNKSGWILNPYYYYLGNPHRGPLGIVFKKRCALEIGGFRTDYFPSADYDFWVRFAVKYKVFFINIIVGQYNIEVNECLRKETLTGWLIQSREIREEISRNIYVSKLFAKISEFCIPYCLIGSANRTFGFQAKHVEFGLRFGSISIAIEGFFRLLTGVAKFFMKRHKC